MGWKYEFYNMLESSVKIIFSYTNRKEKNDPYRISALKIMETEIWKKTIVFLSLCGRNIHKNNEDSEE